MEDILTAISAAVATTTDALGDVLVANLPAIFVVFGGLVALNLVIRLIKRLVGRRA